MRTIWLLDRNAYLSQLVFCCKNPLEVVVLSLLITQCALHFELFNKEHLTFYLFICFKLAGQSL